MQKSWKISCTFWLLVWPKLHSHSKRPCQGGSHVARLNFKTSRVGVYKCLSLTVGFAVTIAIWPREVVSCRHFILRTVATFKVMSLVGIYPGRPSSNFLIPSSDLTFLKAKNWEKSPEGFSKTVKFIQDHFHELLV